MYVGFGLLTICTSFDILFHEFPESGAFVLFTYEFPSVRNTRMSCCGGIVKGLKDVMSKVWVVFKENFVGMCWSEEVIREKDMWFISIHPLVKVFLCDNKLAMVFVDPGMCSRV